MNSRDHLTPATLQTLRALWELPEMKVAYCDFRKLTGVKPRYYQSFARRLEAERMILSEAQFVYLTFKGMMSLRRHYQALFEKRPSLTHLREIEAYRHLPYREASA
jgi:hypothetical protein